MSVLENLKFGKVEPGLIRLGMNGQLAVKTGGDYKYYNPTKKRLISCDNFVFDIGSEFFFVIPTNKVKKGDIIIVNKQPVYVLEPEKDGEIKVLSYIDGTIKQILPERHTFLGESYMYSKIVSMLGNKQFNKNSIFKFMMLNSMMGNGNGGLFGGAANNANGMNPMMMMMMMGGNNPFADMFDFGDDAEGMFGGIFGGDDTEDDEEDEKEGE